MENYYDATIFHRLVPGFIVQGGDPTGTGMGGESIYGKPFKDEFHSRVCWVLNLNHLQAFLDMVFMKNVQEICPYLTLLARNSNKRKLKH